MTCPSVGFRAPRANNRTDIVLQSNGVTVNNLTANSNNNYVFATVHEFNGVQAIGATVSLYWESQVYLTVFGPPPNPPAGTTGDPWGIIGNPPNPLTIDPLGAQTFVVQWFAGGISVDMGVLCVQASLPEQALGACAAIPPPGSSYTDTSKVYNATRPLSVVQPTTLIATRTTTSYEAEIVTPTTHYALGIVNTTTTLEEAHVSLSAIAAHDSKYAEHPWVQELLAKNRRWLRPKASRLTLGNERALGGDRPGRIGNVGPLAADAFSRFVDSDHGHHHKFELRGGEMRQLLIDVEQPSDARPGDFYVLEIDRGGEAGSSRRQRSAVVLEVPSFVDRM